MMVKRLVVSVVDDDECAPESLPNLLWEFVIVADLCVGVGFFGFGISRSDPCLLLDIAMPGMTRPDFQRELKIRRWVIPIVYIIAHGEANVRPSLLEQGAADFISRFLSDTALRDAVNAAL
jgi:FixJ family two-component response regulator